MHTEYQTHKPRCVGCQVWLGSARGLAITVYPSLMTPSLRRGPWKRGLAFHRQPVPPHFLAFWLLQSTLFRLLLPLASSLASLLFPLQRLVRCPVEKLRWAFGPRTTSSQKTSRPLLSFYSLSTPYCSLILLSPNSSLLTSLPVTSSYWLLFLVSSYFQRVLTYMHPPYPVVTEEANLE